MAEGTRNSAMAALSFRNTANSGSTRGPDAQDATMQRDGRSSAAELGGHTYLEIPLEVPQLLVELRVPHAGHGDSMCAQSPRLNLEKQMLCALGAAGEELTRLDGGDKGLRANCFFRRFAGITKKRKGV